MARFYKGKVVTMFVKGAGTVSAEKHTVKEVVDGIVYLEDSPKTFNLDGKWTEVDEFFGFEFWID